MHVYIIAKNAKNKHMYFESRSQAGAILADQVLESIAMKTARWLQLARWR